MKRRHPVDPTQFTDSPEDHVAIYLAHALPSTPDQKAHLVVYTQPTRKVTTERRSATLADYCKSLGVEFASRNKNWHKESRCFERTCLYMSSNDNFEIQVVVRTRTQLRQRNLPYCKAHECAGRF